jgi:hypothetical protein
MSARPDLTDADDLGNVAGKALDMGCHPSDMHHRLVSHRRPAPQDITTLLSEAAEGLRMVSSARDAAARLLTRLSAAPWTVKSVLAEGGHAADYRVVLALGAAQASVQIRCLPCPHVIHIRM